MPAVTHVSPPSSLWLTVYPVAVDDPVQARSTSSADTPAAVSTPAAAGGVEARTDPASGTGGPPVVA